MSEPQQSPLFADVILNLHLFVQNVPIGQRCQLDWCTGGGVSGRLQKQAPDRFGTINYAPFSVLAQLASTTSPPGNPSSSSSLLPSSPSLSPRDNNTNASGVSSNREHSSSSSSANNTTNHHSQLRSSGSNLMNNFLDACPVHISLWATTERRLAGHEESCIATCSLNCAEKVQV
jgi:hypothetical protein